MSTKPIFTSFEEIDHKLQILKLQRQIEMEQMRLHINGAKSNLMPASLMGGVGKWSKRLLISFITKRILRKLR